MLLFKTIKLPIHIKRKNRTCHKNYTRKKYSYSRRQKGITINKKAFLVLGAIIVLYGLKNHIFLNENNSNYNEYNGGSVFSVESGAYIDEGLLDTSNLKNNFKKILFKKDGTPEILILHTHTSESYTDGNGGSGGTVKEAGDKLAEIISENYGVGVVHDVSAYDNADGTVTTDGSYERSGEGIQKLLSKYPDIKVIIDIHRDSAGSNGKDTVILNGSEAARLMLVNGVCALNENGQKADAGVENPYIAQNLAYSYALKNSMDLSAPGVMKNIYIKPYRYSLNNMPCSFLLEAGNEQNTLEEVENSLSIFAESLFNSLEEN